MSDNGTPFTSQEFAEFMKKNGVVHVRTAPYHPASNGQVERYVATFKSSFKSLEGSDTDVKLDRLLFQYRTTPHSSTGVSPAEKLMKRRLRTPFDQLRPNQSSRDAAKRFELRGASKLREFVVGESVLTLNFSTLSQCKWLSGIVVQRLGNTNYVVELGTGERLHRHVDQLLPNESLEAGSSIFGREAAVDPVMEPTVEMPVAAPAGVAPTAQLTPVEASPVRETVVEPHAVVVPEGEMAP